MIKPILIFHPPLFLSKFFFVSFCLFLACKPCVSSAYAHFLKQNNTTILGMVLACVQCLFPPFLKKGSSKNNFKISSELSFPLQGTIFNNCPTVLYPILAPPHVPNKSTQSLVLQPALGFTTTPSGS